MLIWALARKGEILLHRNCADCPSPRTTAGFYKNTSELILGRAFVVSEAIARKARTGFNQAWGASPRKREILLPP